MPKEPIYITNLRTLRGAAVEEGIAYIDALRAYAEGLEKDAQECICKGNWQQIVRECKPFIGKYFINEKGEQYLFFGPVHGDDDYYYGMIKKGASVRLLSCVGNIEGWGFEPVDAAKGAERE